MLSGIFTVLRKDFSNANDFILFFSNALPQPVFITFLAGHHIFNSIQENVELRIQNSELSDFFLFFSEFCILHSAFKKYFFSISLKHLVRNFSSDPNICIVTCFWSLSVKRCFATPIGLITYPSAFMNSVRRYNWCFFFSPYLSKISFTIWRKAQSVYQSMGAKPSIICIEIRE